ncbi:unnamed protein product, partial [Ascophyllum nodosum]
MVKLQHPTWTLKKIGNELRRKFSTLVLPHVPRLLPNPDVTLALYDDLCKVYGPIPDATTGKPFFHKRLHKEVNNLRVHIAKGCLSDPIDAAMYAHDGKTLHGLDKTRSLRSTNRVENL